LNAKNALLSKFFSKFFGDAKSHEWISQLYRLPGVIRDDDAMMKRDQR
jgi:hypothetical protein